MELPKDKAGLTLEHNPHKGSYTPLTEWFSARDMLPREDKTAFADIAGEELQKCLRKDEVWVLQWYPNTPGGFYAVAASTLQGVLEAAANVVREEGL
jgi:hypothetical protein